MFKFLIFDSMGKTTQNTLFKNHCSSHAAVAGGKEADPPWPLQPGLGSLYLGLGFPWGVGFPPGLGSPPWVWAPTGSVAGTGREPGSDH